MEFLQKLIHHFQENGGEGTTNFFTKLSDFNARSESEVAKTINSDLTFTTGDITWNLTPILLLIGIIYLFRVVFLLSGDKFDFDSTGTGYGSEISSTGYDSSPSSGYSAPSSSYSGNNIGQQQTNSGYGAPAISSGYSGGSVAAAPSYTPAGNSGFSNNIQQNYNSGGGGVTLQSTFSGSNTNSFSNNNAGTSYNSGTIQNVGTSYSSGGNSFSTGNVISQPQQAGYSGGSFGGATFTTTNNNNNNIGYQGSALSREDILQYALQDLLGYNTEEANNPDIYTSRKFPQERLQLIQEIKTQLKDIQDKKNN